MPVVSKMHVICSFLSCNCIIEFLTEGTSGDRFLMTRRAHSEMIFGRITKAMRAKIHYLMQSCVFVRYVCACGCLCVCVPVCASMPVIVSSGDCVCGDGSNYAGVASVTHDQEQCVPWDPQLHSAASRPNSTYPWSATVANHCRNPEGRSSTPWCYTGIDTLSDCNIPRCSNGKFISDLHTVVLHWNRYT